MSIRHAALPISEGRHRDDGLTASRLIQSARNLTRRLAGRAAVALHELFGAGRPGSFGQLLYHRVISPVPGLAPPTMNVRPARLAAQLEGLARRGFQFWSLAELLDAVESGQAIPGRTASVTFDDGFESIYHNAWPILRRLGIPSTVFLSTAYLDGNEPFFFDDWALTDRERILASCYRPLRRSQCLEMASSGLVSFGAHLHTHGDFRGQPDAFQRDLQQSVNIVSTLFDIDVESVPFAFPFGKSRLGYVDAALVSAARRVGVRCGLTTDSLPVPPGADPFAWGRFNVYDWDTADTLVAKLAGWYGWLDACRGTPRRPDVQAAVQAAVQADRQTAVQTDWQADDQPDGQPEAVREGQVPA